MNFEEKIKLGRIGEDIVYNYFVNLGYKVQFYGDRNNQHDIDLIVNDGNETFLVDVKTKRCREKYPDTGFDYRDYLYYNQLSVKKNIDVYIIFVDYHLGKVYHQNLNELDFYDGTYPIIFTKYDYEKGVDKSIIYFPLYILPDLFFLEDDEVELLRTNSDEYKG